VIDPIFPNEFGFVTGGNSSAPYGLISSLKYKPILDNIKDYVGFILYVNDKHVLAGLPEESIIGTTIRRLSICLSRSPNVHKLYYINIDNLKCLHFILKNINLIEKSIFDKICQTGRTKYYNIDYSDIKNNFRRIEHISEYKMLDDDAKSLNGLKSKLTESLLSLDRLKLPIESQFLKWQPKYEIETRLVTNDTPSFDNIESILNYAQWQLLTFGKLGSDRSDLFRIQLNHEFRFEFKNYSKQKIETYLKNNYTIYHNPIRIYDESVCKEGSFCERIRGLSNEMDKYEEFISELKNALNNDRLCYSKVLYFVTNLDSGYDQTQIGWESITPYLDRDKNGYKLSLKHNLRSVDLYDGFPFNLYFCIKISEDIINMLKNEELNIRLESVYINIANLHAYVDCIPKSYTRSIFEKKLVIVQ